MKKKVFMNKKRKNSKMRNFKKNFWFFVNEFIKFFKYFKKIDY